MQSVTPRRKRRSSYDALPRWLTWRRVVAFAAAVTVLVVGVWGTRVVLSLDNLFHQGPLATVRTLLGGHGGSDVAQKQHDLRRINIALYGYGGPGHDGPYLTDSIMVVSIQPQASGPARVAEISIPRDWWVPLDLGNGKTVMNRVNTAYESGQVQAPYSSDVYKGDHGGGQLADATLERMLGIHIDYFIGIDFTAFKSAVDSVGGIDVNVEHTFTDYRYPAGECGGPNPNCGYETLHFDAGLQHMDGATALKFARSRESTDPQEGTNFARNKRQQLVLTAVKKRVLSVGGIKNLPDLINALGDHIIMNVSLDNALSLYDLTKDTDTASITHISIDDTNFIYECGVNCDAAIEFPHDRTFATVHHFVDQVFVPGDALAEKAPVTLLDSSGGGNRADQRWASLLTPLGLNAQAGGIGRPAQTTHVIDTTGGRGARTAAWLAQYFGVRAESTEQASAALGHQVSVAQGQVTVILGADEERSFNNPDPGLYR